MFSSFGAQNTANNTTSTGGLFGQQNQQQQPSTSLFGSTTQTQQNPQQAQPSLFGNTAPTNTGTSLFGSTNQAQNTTTNAFGQPQQSAPGGGLFGSATTTTQPATSLFGNTNTNTNTNTGGGLFGNTNTAGNTTGGIFGNTNTANTNTGGGLFGNANTTNATAGGGLFGASTTNQQQLGGGLFGNAQQNQTNQPGGLFGSTLNTNKPAGSLFGSTIQPAAGSGLFGAQSTNPQSQPNSALGASTLSMSALGTPSSLLPTRGPLTNAQADPQTQFAQLAQRIEATARAWDSSSPECRFQHYFYNLVDPKQVQLYGRPPNATNETLWQKAVRENPDPKCLVPVLAVGFDDLRTRVEAQTQQAATHQEKLKELKDRLSALAQRHAVSNSSRLSRAASTQRQITHRLLIFIQHLHLLIPTLRSSALSGEEEQLRMRLEEIEEDIRRGRAQSRLNELWALVGAANAARGRNGGGGNGGEWVVVDEEGLAHLSQILTEQQNGLAHLTSFIQKDLKDLGIIMGTDSETSEQLSNSTTLRGSVLR